MARLQDGIHAGSHAALGAAAALRRNGISRE
jgi:hypothetical protein